MAGTQTDRGEVIKQDHFNPPNGNTVCWLHQVFGTCDSIYQFRSLQHPAQLLTAKFVYKNANMYSIGHQ